jgi:hypothetical protein
MQLSDSVFHRFFSPLFQLLFFVEQIITIRPDEWRQSLFDRVDFLEDTVQDVLTLSWGLLAINCFALHQQVLELI